MSASYYSNNYSHRLEDHMINIPGSGTATGAAAAAATRAIRATASFMLEEDRVCSVVQRIGLIER